MKEITNNEFWDLTDEERKKFTGIVNYGSQSYYQNGKLHRIDGPAFEYPDGYIEYWIYGIRTTKEGQELYHSLMKLKRLT